MGCHGCGSHLFQKKLFKIILHYEIYITFATEFKNIINNMKRLLILLAIIAITIAGKSQITTSSISGRVTDEARSALQGTTVVATYTPTGSKYSTVVDANGIYRLQNVRPGGPYTIEFRMVGFQPVTHNNINVALGETCLINISMKEDAINLSEIVISADAIHGDNGGITTEVSKKEIETLPTVNRNLNDVLALTPQASTTSLGLAIGGGNYRQSYVTVDGATFHNSYGIGTNIPAGGTPISLDALETMTISVAPYDVRQSGFTGGIVNAVTKSGSNDLHFSIYDYFTNDGLTGTKYGRKNENGLYPDNLKIAKSLENTIGFSIGGPIVKNKLFYFLNVEYQSDIERGHDRLARASEDDPYGSGTQYNRPTVERMDEISDYLKETYGYDPGSYQNLSFKTPDYKVLARLDWNINSTNHLNVRFTTARHQQFSTPSNSITPLSSSLYNKNYYGRGSIYSLYFESSCYYQQQNFTSAAAELNSAFLDGRLNNTLRFVYSKQYEPRRLTRDVFPTVDILETLEDGTKAVYTSFGPDPFTYGTGSTVHNFIATDELSYSIGIHNITAGLQFEFDKTKNGYMPAGAGYYVYNSWDDFVNNATPAAFTITFGNNEEHSQVFPSFNYLQYSVYAQDEMTFNDRFKLTAGLRLEIPTYPSIADQNTNMEFINGWDKHFTDADGNDSIVHQAIADGDNSLAGLSTADMPKARVNVSPRLGFKWDILGNDKLVLNGSTGLYTGRLPLVWIVQTVCNSNVAQNQYIAYNQPISFYDNVSDIVANNQDVLTTGDLPAPMYPLIIDKDLKMQQTWKSALSLEATLPYDIKASIEGFYGKDLTSIALTRLGIRQEGSIQLPCEPDERDLWVSEGIKNSVGGSINPYYLTNSENKGHYYSITARVAKSFKIGLRLSAAYSFAQGKNVIDGIGDNMMTAFTSNTFGVNGSNAHELGYSSYITPHHVLASAGWVWNEGKRNTETISLYYEGANLMYVGGYSYSRYSYTMTSNVSNDGGANSLIYIPTTDQLAIMPFSSIDNRNEFEDFIKGDKYLSKHRGQYAERGGVVAPFFSTFNMKYEHSVRLGDLSKNCGTLHFGIDIKNVANLIYRGWGNMQYLNSGDILKWDATNGEYTFVSPTLTRSYASTVSTWAATLNLRYSF